MGFHNLFFWRKPAVSDLAALANFIDEQAAFVVQKGIFEYSRARAGHYAKVLFGEREFLDAVERARWSAFPLGLAMVAEVAEGILRPRASVDGAAPQRDGLWKLVLAAFDRYPAPAALDAAAWQDSRAELERRLQQVGLHAPKRAIDIPAPFIRRYFDLMPIHKNLRGSDLPTLHNYLMVTLCNVHDELTRRADLPALVALLDQDRAGVPAPAQ